jgi:hypothetical protein
MTNILKCVDEPLLTNASALNEVKTLDYITMISYFLTIIKPISPMK